MKFDISLEEAYQKYLELYLYDIRVIPEYYRHADQKKFLDFYKDVDCSEIYFKLMESRSYGTPDSNSNFSRLYRTSVDEGNTVTVIDPIRLELISKYKRMGLNFKRNDPKTNCAAQNAIDMLQSDENGLYYFVLKDYEGIAGKYYSCFLAFYPSAKFYEVGINYPFLLLPFSDEIPIELADEDVVMFANKIYKTGLPYVFETLKSGETIKITDEDRKYYQSSSTDPILPEIEVLDLDDETVDNKLESEKFRKFKAEREVRERHQDELRRMIVLENETKESWHNSSENPTNRRIEELKQMRKKIQGLDNLYNIDSSMLTAEQIEYLEKGKVFFDMFDRAEEEKHEVDSGMSEEIRNWYQEHYIKEEGRSK